MKVTKKSIDPKIIKFAKGFGIDIRIGKKPSDCKIIGVDEEIPEYVPAVYFGEGVIFVKDKVPCNKTFLQSVILHEIGHAITDFKPVRMKVAEEAEEIGANAVCLALHAILKIKPDKSIPKLFSDFANEVIHA